MKPVSIIFLIIAVVLTVVGLLMCSIAALQAKRQGIELFDTKIVDGQSESEYDFSEDTIGKIQIKADDCDVSVICGADKNLVKMKNFPSAGYICEVDNRALVIEDTVNLFDIADIIENGKIRIKGFRYYLRDRKITVGKKSLEVYISDKFDIKIIDITVNTGNVNIIGYENNTDYTVNITKGDFTASDIVTTSDVTVTTEQGAIDLGHVSARAVKITSGNGNIAAVLSAKEITADAKNGSVVIESEKDLSNYNFVLRAPDSTVKLEEFTKVGNYIANDAQLTSFIHANAVKGTVTVKTYVAPLTPPEYETEPEFTGESEDTGSDYPPSTAAAE